MNWMAPMDRYEGALLIAGMLVGAFVLYKCHAAVQHDQGYVPQHIELRSDGSYDVRCCNGELLRVEDERVFRKDDGAELTPLNVIRPVQNAVRTLRWRGDSSLTRKCE